MKDLCAMTITAFCLAVGVADTSAADAGHRVPSSWPVAAPEVVGIDSAALVEMFDFVRQRQIPVHSVQIVRYGKFVLDAYFYPFDGNTRHDIASVTKSVTSTLIGLAIDRGHIRDVNQPLLKLFPEHSVTRLDSRKQKLTLGHLLTMQAGWDCGFEPNEARLGEMRRSADWVSFMLDLPMVAEPGTRWAYCSGNCHVLSAILTRTIGTNALAFAQRELFGPLDIRDVHWPGDSFGNSHGWGDLQMHPRDMAKLGQLFLQQGRWNGRQVISRRWIESATRAHVQRTSNADGYGYFWWVKGTNYPGMFEAVGRGGQRITIWPAKDLVIVFTGGGFEPGDLGKFIVQALKSDQPLPKSNLSMQLQQRIAAAARTPLPKPVAPLPGIAEKIAGRRFHLFSNSLSVTTLMLLFDKSAQAEAELEMFGHRIRCPVGLDDVERFSTNSLVRLPVASKGQWIKDNTFVLQLDLVGGINCYRFTLQFEDNARTVHVTLNERTGLNDESFQGAIR